MKTRKTQPRMFPHATGCESCSRLPLAVGAAVPDGEPASAFPQRAQCSAFASFRCRQFSDRHTFKSVCENLAQSCQHPAQSNRARPRIPQDRHTREVCLHRSSFPPTRRCSFSPHQEQCIVRSRTFPTFSKPANVGAWAGLRSTTAPFGTFGSQRDGGVRIQSIIPPPRNTPKSSPRLRSQ